MKGRKRVDARKQEVNSRELAFDLLTPDDWSLIGSLSCNGCADEEFSTQNSKFCIGLLLSTSRPH